MTEKSRTRSALGLLIVVVAGVAIGLGAYTFSYADGASYLTDDPNACANCHVMRPQLDGWQASSHAGVAVCNDCHAPHSSMAAKYAVKAINGWNHSWAFTLDTYEDNLAITDLNRRVAEAACRHCHAAMTHDIDVSGVEGDQMSCLRCHEGIGHDQ